MWKNGVEDGLNETMSIALAKMTTMYYNAATPIH